MDPLATSSSSSSTDPNSASSCSSAFNDLEIDNLPNRITLFRIFLIPIVVGCLLIQTTDALWVLPYKTRLGWLAGIIFIIASLTDLVDGHIARKRNIVTIFGSFLDPIADKFLVVSVLLFLQALGRVHVLIVLILVLREIFMTSLRLLAAHEGVSVPVNALGKWKTATQMIGIPLLLIYESPWGLSMPLLGNIFIYIASVLSLYSAIQYSLGLIKKLKQNRMQKKQDREKERDKDKDKEKEKEKK